MARTAYPAYAVSTGSGLVGRIRRSRHPAVVRRGYCRMARERLSGLRRFSGLRFGRPDKAQPPSGNGVAGIMPDGAYRLSGLRRFSGHRFGRPDKAQPPSGNGVAGIMPDGA